VRSGGGVRWGVDIELSASVSEQAMDFNIRKHVKAWKKRPTGTHLS
jgi:hypothetical protein